MFCVSKGRLPEFENVLESLCNSLGCCAARLGTVHTRRWVPHWCGGGAELWSKQGKEEGEKKRTWIDYTYSKCLNLIPSVPGKMVWDQTLRSVFPTWQRMLLRSVQFEGGRNNCARRELLDQERKSPIDHYRNCCSCWSHSRSIGGKAECRVQSSPSWRHC